MTRSSTLPEAWVCPPVGFVCAVGWPIIWNGAQPGRPILAPLATELPEKFNSIFWMREGKDTLALGNVTGAMMFQSTVPVAFGVLFTPWNLAPLDLFAVVLALASGGLVYLSLRLSGKVLAGRLMLGGLFYLAFVVGAVIAVL